MLLHHLRTGMHLPAANPVIHNARLLSPSLNLYSLLKTVRQTLHGRVIMCGLWPLQSPNLIPCDFCLWGSLKDKVYKTNPHTLDELRNNIRPEIWTISAQEHQTVNVFRSSTECIRSGGQHSQHLL
jgi:hypothetical protein